jgi:hypothetical protein
LRQKIFVYDLGETSLQQAFREKGWLVGRRLGLHFIDPDGEILARYASIGDAALMSAEDPGFWRTHLDYLVEDVEIENVVDLRLPATQEWFCEAFREGYGDFWRKPAGRSLGRFQDMLPMLMMADLGGCQVTDAIGFSLRKIGAAGLIYPSARCDPETVVDNGELRGWMGFNLVDFRDSEIETGGAGEVLRFDDPEPWDSPMKWPNLRCEIAELSENRELAERWKGSWRLLGVRACHEQFWDAGGLLGGRDIGEWEKQEINPSGTVMCELIRLRKNGGAEWE